MKVKCINNRGFSEDVSYFNITVGKSYELIERFKHRSGEKYRIKNNNGHIQGYPAFNFKTLDEIRTERINEILL